jgi:hypothetical protein
MSERKETPDILGDILGGETPAGPLPPAETAPPAALKPARAAKTKRSPARRSKTTKSSAWQYRLVSCQEYKGWRPRYVDGEEMADWMEAPPLAEYLAQVGEQGWELVSACSGEKMYGLADRYQLFLKRPK